MTTPEMLTFAGLVLNAIAIVRVAMIYERRMTSVETIVNILASQNGLNAHKRKDDKP